MTESPLCERFLRKPLEEALQDTPVVLIHGLRQCGKTILTRLVGDAAGYEYITFDDDVQLATANADPVHFAAVAFFCDSCRGDPIVLTSQRSLWYGLLMDEGELDSQGTCKQFLQVRGFPGSFPGSEMPAQIG